MWNTCKKWKSKKVIDCIITNMQTKQKNRRVDDLHAYLMEWLLIGGGWCCRRRTIRFRSWWIKTERSGLPGESAACTRHVVHCVVTCTQFESLSFLLCPLLTYLSYIPYFRNSFPSFPAASTVSPQWVSGESHAVVCAACGVWTIKRLFVAVDL